MDVSALFSWVQQVLAEANLKRRHWRRANKALDR